MAKDFELKKIGKGKKFVIEKDFGLSKIGVGLGWKANPVNQNDPFDLDVSAFLVTEDGVIEDEHNFVYYRSDNRSKPFDKAIFTNKKKWILETRPMSADGSLLGANDNVVGGAGDVETMNVDLDNVDQSIQEIIFTVTIHDAEERNQNFGMIEDAFIRIYDEENKNGLLQYDLNHNFSSESGVEIGRLIRNIDGEWEFEAVGKGYDGGLQTFIDMYT